MSSAPPPQAPTGPRSAEIIITEWALDSYLNLKHQRVFTDAEYRRTLRPDVKLLSDGVPGSDPKFANPKFWGPAKIGQNVLPHGYKMKWHQLGSGRVQLRLPVASADHRSAPAAFLCESYVKRDALVDQRMMARFKTHLNLIALDKYVYRGSL